MIISASRRTDIPAFYSQWLLNRLNEGYALIPNPRNPNRLGRVSLSPANVDCIAFWTKNPSPMFDKFAPLTAMGYSYYIQFSLTPYDDTVETNLPPKTELVQAFIEMSKQIGRQRSIWRYDPIVINEKHSIGWHKEQFSAMCASLRGYTERCFISFVDPYKSLHSRYQTPKDTEMLAAAAELAEIASRNAITLYTCAEEIDLSCFGIGHGACIDRELIEEIVGQPIKAKKDMGQRAACRCIESVDIGAYDTCSHGCTYCYASSGIAAVMRRMAAHDPYSPMITGHPKGDEIITRPHNAVTKNRPDFPVLRHVAN